GAEGERLQALTESGLLPVGIDDRPPRAGARRDLRADPRYVRTNLWAVASASAQRHADEREAAGTRPPDEWRGVAGGGHRHNRRSPCRVEHREPPAPQH